MNLLTIRPAQMAILREAFLQEWLTRQLLRAFPDECQAMTGKELPGFVLRGMNRAKGFGFAGDEYLPYLALEICFGESFLEDEGNEWARREMSNRTGSPQDRMQRLRSAAIFHLADSADEEQRQEDARQDEQRNAKGVHA